jgi:hypothetical protein
VRAIIVASGDLDNLPGEVQSVANTLSAAGWTVRLCIGADATRAGLLAAAGEGDVDLAWFGCHAGADGFALADGVWPPSQLGVWLRNVNACEVVLNACYSIEHVATIQRAADGVGVACTIAPGGVPDAEAWQVAVYLARAYAGTGDMAAAVRQASGAGAIQYRYVPAGGLAIGGGRRMPAERIEEQLQLLLRALYGEERNNVPGLVRRVDEIQQTLAVMAAERQQWREETERRLAKLEQVKPVTMSERSVLLSGAMVIATISLLLVLLLLLNGRLG